MALLPFVVLLFAYQLGWYGYATLQQPVTGGCIGFTDLLLPGNISKVDNCIKNNWGKSDPAKTSPKKSKAGGRKPGPVPNPHPGHGSPPLKAPHPR